MEAKHPLAPVAAVGRYYTGEYEASEKFACSRPGYCNHPHERGHSSRFDDSSRPNVSMLRDLAASQTLWGFLAKSPSSATPSDRHCNLLMTEYFRLFRSLIP